MHVIFGAFFVTVPLLTLGTFHVVRSWWARALWLIAIAGTYFLGYAALAVHVVMLIVLAVKEVSARTSANADTGYSFVGDSGKIVATNAATGEITVYDSADSMPLHVHAKYLATTKRTT